MKDKGLGGSYKWLMKSNVVELPNLEMVFGLFLSIANYGSGNGD